jgi:uncharacterized OB-fold protein
VAVLDSVEAVDRKAGTVTLSGPKRRVTMNVPSGVDFSKLKVGQEVQAVFIEAAVREVQRNGVL